MAAPSVTVVIPTKDRHEVLRTTLRSVLRQRDVLLQVVVVDDGGSDGTAERLGSAGHPRITVMQHPQSLGVSQARNTGLAEVRTPWVAFLDDDDVWAPGKLARQLAAVTDDTRCRWACSAAASFYPDGSIPVIQFPPAPGDVSVALLRRNVIPGGGSGVLADTALVREIGGFKTSLSNLADWDCWLRLAQKSPLACVDAPDVGYRRNDSSMAHAVQRSEEELARIRANYACLYRAADVEIDWLPWLWYLHRLTYGSGHWREGVGRSWALFRDHRQGRALTQPLKYALPRLARQQEARRVAHGLPEQYAYAMAWLTAAGAMEV